MNGCVQKALYQPERHLPLLLIADPDAHMVARYIRQSTLYEYVDGECLLGVAAVMQVDASTVELKNIAVDNRAQRGGVGSALIAHIVKDTRPFRLIVGTADASSEAQSFYIRNGFQPYAKLTGFFTDNYAEPVYDNGRLCKDMILLEWKDTDGYTTA